MWYNIENAEPDWLESIGIFWPKEEQTSKSGIEYFCDLETINSSSIYITIRTCDKVWVPVLKNPSKGQVLGLLLAVRDSCATSPYYGKNLICSKRTKECYVKHES